MAVLTFATSDPFYEEIWCRELLMPVKVEILFLFLQVNSETALKNCPCSEFFLGTAARGEIPESFNECRHISAGSDQENPVGMCIPVIPALSVLLSGPGVWNLIFLWVLQSRCWRILVPGSHCSSLDIKAWDWELSSQHFLLQMCSFWSITWQCRCVGSAFSHCPLCWEGICCPWAGYKGQQNICVRTGKMPLFALVRILCYYNQVHSQKFNILNRSGWVPIPGGI